MRKRDNHTVLNVPISKSPRGALQMLLVGREANPVANHRLELRYRNGGVNAEFPRRLAVLGDGNVEYVG